MVHERQGTRDGACEQGARDDARDGHVKNFIATVLENMLTAVM